MFSLPEDIIPVIAAFAPLFSVRVWPQAQVLLLGAILTPGKGPVSEVLGTMGLSQDPHYINYHRVLSRAVWNPLQSHLDQASSDGHKPQQGNGHHQQERVEAVRVFQSGLIKLESS